MELRTRLLIRVLFVIAELLAPGEKREQVRNLANHINVAVERAEAAEAK